jgi:hypothetical protein
MTQSSAKLGPWITHYLFNITRRGTVYIWRRKDYDQELQNDDRELARDPWPIELSRSLREIEGRRGAPEPPSRLLDHVEGKGLHVFHGDQATPLEVWGPDGFWTNSLREARIVLASVLESEVGSEHGRAPPGWSSA